MTISSYVYQVSEPHNPLWTDPVRVSMLDAAKHSLRLRDQSGQPIEGTEERFSITVGETVHCWSRYVPSCIGQHCPGCAECARDAITVDYQRRMAELDVVEYGGQSARSVLAGLPQ